MTHLRPSAADRQLLGKNSKRKEKQNLAGGHSMAFGHGTRGCFYAEGVSKQSPCRAAHAGSTKTLAAIPTGVGFTSFVVESRWGFVLWAVRVPGCAACAARPWVKLCNRFAVREKRDFKRLQLRNEPRSPPNLCPKLNLDQGSPKPSCRRNELRASSQHQARRHMIRRGDTCVSPRRGSLWTASWQCRARQGVG